MSRTAFSAALAILALPVLVATASPAHADDDYCKVPQGEWQPKEALEAKLKGEGWDIRKIKVEDGCYEVYGIDQSGAKQEVLFNPKTFELVRKS